jgi:hypothetical protein
VRTSPRGRSSRVGEEEEGSLLAGRITARQRAEEDKKEEDRLKVDLLDARDEDGKRHHAWALSSPGKAREKER